MYIYIYILYVYTQKRHIFVSYVYTIRVCSMIMLLTTVLWLGQRLLNNASCSHHKAAKQPIAAHASLISIVRTSKNDERHVRGYLEKNKNNMSCVKNVPLDCVLLKVAARIGVCATNASRHSRHASSRAGTLPSLNMQTSFRQELGGCNCRSCTHWCTKKSELWLKAFEFPQWCQLSLHSSFSVFGWLEP